MTRRRLRPLAATMAVTLSLTCLVSAPTAASAALGAPASISPAGYDSYDQHQAFDRQGDALFTWVREDHTYPRYRYVQIKPRSYRGTWGATTTVSPYGQDPRAPKVALDDDGDALVVWHAYDGVDYHAYARRVSRYGVLGPLVELSGAGLTVHGTNVAVDADGDAVITWIEWDEDVAVRPMMRRWSSSGSLSPAVALATTPAHAETPAVAYDREGDAVLAWANDNVVQARTLRADGTLGELRTVSAPLSPIDRHFTAKVTVDRDGDALVTWRHWTAADQSDQIWGRWLSREGTVGDVRQLTPSAHTDPVNYSIAGDLDGDMLLTWDLFERGHLYSAAVSRTGTVGEPVLLSAFGRMHSVRVDDDGDGIVVWQGQGIDGSVSSIAARRVNRSGTFGATQVVVPNGTMPTAAVTPGGRAAVAWQRRFQVDLQVQASVDSYLIGQSTRS
ncbi:hypothetical protein [Micromonospora coxensis]|uniref:Uncharacterized protein n=1 Tax=Micromonospora coxensis TaxID=356852 RepID=A0A1C5IZE3_9ACTN|nr:hypothetical protein [Micromonospora coxensis]SCG63690.1 hypothetical protein GA0070614_3690 [Micromonospora coxensis]